MNEFLLIIIGIVLIANLAFTIWSYFSLKKIVKISEDGKIKKSGFLEHMVHTRSSINLIYASIATITFVLAFLGYNLKDKISQDVTKEISASAKVDIDLLKTKSNEITTLDSIAIIKSKELNSLYAKAKIIVEDMNKSRLQQIYVIQDLQVSPQKHYFNFSELRTINNEKLPSFTKAPVVITLVDLYGVNVTTTNEGIDFPNTTTNYKMDICIFPKK